MPKFTEEETLLLKETITHFGKRLTEAYNDKPNMRAFLKEKGYKVPPDDEVDDGIYETLMTLDWLRKDPDRIGEVSPTLFYAILQIIESNLPEELSTQEDDIAMSVLQKGAVILGLNKKINLN